MALYDSLSAAVTPLAASLVGSFGGSRVTVRANTPTRQRDGSTGKSWSDVAGLVARDASIANIASDRAVRVWGTDRRIVAEATVTIPASVALDAIAVDMGLVVTEGPRAGQKFLVAGVGVEDIARLVTVALESTSDGSL